MREASIRRPNVIGDRGHQLKPGATWHDLPEKSELPMELTGTYAFLVGENQDRELRIEP